MNAITLVPLCAAVLLTAVMLLRTVFFTRRRRQRRPAGPKRTGLPLPDLPERLGDLRILVHAINEDRCIGCEACVLVCPTNVLALRQNKVQVERFGDCVQCQQCERVCPTQALVMHPEGAEPPTVLLPDLDEYYQSRAVPGLYLIGQAAGRPLIKHAVNLGRLAVEHILAGGLPPRSTAAAHGGSPVDVIILGSGPAGLSAALTCGQRGLSCVVIEKDIFVASTLARYPRGKRVMAEPYEVRCVGPLPVRDAGKDELIGEWNRLLRRARLDVRQPELAEDVRQDGDGFVVRTDRGRYHGRRVIVAIGGSGRPRRLGVPGEDLPHVSTALCDPGRYRGRSVLVIGGGDSAVEAALALSAAALGNQVWISYRRRQFTRIRPGNRQALDLALTQGRLRLLLGSEVVSFAGHRTVVRLSNGQRQELPVDHAVVLLGTDPPREWLARIGIAQVECPFSFRSGRTDELVEHLAGGPLLGQQGPCGADSLRATAILVPGDNLLLRRAERYAPPSPMPRVDELRLTMTRFPSPRPAALSVADAGPGPLALPPVARAERVLQAARDAPIFTGIDEGRIVAALGAAQLHLLDLQRDRLLDTGDHLIIVSAGQIALGTFLRQVLSAERRAQREQARPTEAGPLGRLCESNLAVFSPGELLDPALLVPDTEGVPALFTLTPARVLCLSRRLVTEWRAAVPAFAQRVRRAADQSAARLQAGARDGGAVADFFVRQGISVARTLRVRDLDRCIECHACEEACAERHGAQRLWLPGKILGVLDFVSACRTCTDPRCLDACTHDAIVYDAERREVVIREESCTGCTLCARACPYDAIKMYELGATPGLRRRLERDGKVTAPRIASKCDHCTGHEDQACISACPTGALLEVPPERALLQRTADVAGDDGLRWPWLVSLPVFLACLAEIVLRHAWPRCSLLFLYETRVQGLEPEVALLGIHYYPGSPFAVWLGRLGALLLFSSLLYPLHRLLPIGGNARRWFGHHLWAGTTGGLFTVLHSAFNLNPPVHRVTPNTLLGLLPLLAFWFMVATVLSGLLGRFLSTHLPGLAGQATLLEAPLVARLQKLRSQHPGVLQAELYCEQVCWRYRGAPGRGRTGLGAALLALGTLLLDQVRRPLFGPALASRLVAIKDRRVLAEVVRLTTALLLIRRRQLLLPRLQPLLRWWQVVHVPAATLLAVLLSVHVLIEEAAARLRF